MLGGLAGWRGLILWCRVDFVAQGRFRHLESWIFVVSAPTRFAKRVDSVRTCMIMRDGTESSGVSGWGM